MEWEIKIAVLTFQNVVSFQPEKRILQEKNANFDESVSSILQLAARRTENHIDLSNL